MLSLCPMSVGWLPYGLGDAKRVRFGVEALASSSIGDSTIGWEIMGVEELRKGMERMLSGGCVRGPWNESCEALGDKASPLDVSGLEGYDEGYVLDMVELDRVRAGG